jgi:hypothetical protein
MTNKLLRIMTLLAFSMLVAVVKILPEDGLSLHVKQRSWKDPFPKYVSRSMYAIGAFVV